MLHTFLILDGHPDTFATTSRLDDKNIDPTLKVPYFPLWTSMVSSSLEFCRIVWEIQSSQPYLINVLVANKQPIVLNHVEQQNTTTLERQFPHAQPRECSPDDRLQKCIEKALALYVQHHQQDNVTLRRCRVILLTLVKEASEKPFQLSHVQVDVLRLLPYANTPGTVLEHSILSKQISSEITMSVYTLPNHQHSLLHAMRHLAQLYYNINTLHITNIPMKSSTAQQQSTHTVTFYYQANGSHLINQQAPLANQYIHEPDYLSHRSLTLLYFKRSKRALSATQVYVGMTTQGSISYLTTPNQSHTNDWTHMLRVQPQGNKKTIYLHCLNTPLKQQFTQAENDILDLSRVKTENDHDEGFLSSLHGPLKPEENPLKIAELIDTIIRPNLYDTIQQFIEAPRKDPLCRRVNIHPLRYSRYLPLIHSSAILSATTDDSVTATTTPTTTTATTKTPSAMQTMRFIEKATQEEEEEEEDGATSIDAAWDQVKRYETMSLREREEVAKGILPSMVKPERYTHPPPLPSSAGGGGKIRFNPNFRPKTDMGPSPSPLPPKYPDPSVAVPYLDFVAPTLDEKAKEEKEEEARLGKPGNLLWLYWKSDKIGKHGHSEEGDLMASGSELVFKNNRWKRIKKEFHGRVAQPGEKGETF
ncbi:hypothetical protein BDF20DRAFT_820877 [Mycotypha africana]|uniref:uncharacterized protein n=1 Tax=Mycotypha africana TaxID=64632 RepID=UPI002300092A|nr:uncharacterized protein BDF20DRAFT_820877 [Mycotypha africana]KAI8977333.1 hypothetical protein BDF20DRAFT_820877 [Mycotypha africana]